MAVKMITVQFDLDIELFTKILAHSNQGVKFSVYGDDKPQRIEEPERQLTLAPPKKGVRHVLLPYMKKHPDKTFTTKEMIAIASNFGYNESAVYNAVHNMHRDGLLRRYTPGKYRISKAGITHG